MIENRELLKVAKETAEIAGEYILSRSSTVKQISHKSGLNDIVTDVDRKSEEIIITNIRKFFPKHSILAEERGSDLSESDYKWIIDPLDGTTNYTHGFPVYCVSIGISFQETIVAGVVYDPTRDELFFASKGDGAFLNGNKIVVSNVEKVEASLISTGFAYSLSGKLANLELFTSMMDKAQAVRRPGSAAIDLCYVACGRLDAFWELGLCPWDTAAGVIVTQEAGGFVSKIDGTDFKIYDKEVVASNGKVHNEVLKILSRK